MEKFKEIFNFDDIGGKIKDSAKWSCWISIIVVWIASVIAFIVLVVDEYTIGYFWIPIVAAFVGPFGIWMSYWAMYAFGELVENSARINAKLRKQSNIEAALSEQLEVTKSIANSLNKLCIEKESGEAATPCEQVDEVVDTEEVKLETEIEEPAEDTVKPQGETVKKDACEVCGKEGEELFWYTEDCGWYVRNRRLCKNCMEIAEHNENQVKK